MNQLAISIGLLIALDLITNFTNEALSDINITVDGSTYLG